MYKEISYLEYEESCRQKEERIKKEEFKEKVSILDHCRQKCSGCNHNKGNGTGLENCYLYTQTKHEPVIAPGVKEISVKDAAQVVFAFCNCRKGSCDKCPFHSTKGGFEHCTVYSIIH